jgi:hypothetical protein
MATEIKTGVWLSLKDNFSENIKKAGTESGKFADKTLGAINKIDKAISGTGAKLAAFGLSFSLGAVTKDIIELDHRMARVGLTANASMEQIAALKKEIFKAAKSPDIKIDPSEIVSGVETIMTKTGDLKFAEANIRNVGLAIQASGESGGAIGDVFAEFAKNGYSAEQISRLMDDMVAQSDQGEFTFAEFAKNAKGVLSAYSAIGKTPEDIKRANAAMQVLVAGTKSSEVATTVLNSAINELLDPAKRDKLEKLGIKVRDSAGQMRDFNDIMLDLAAASEDLKKADTINSLFGSESLKAIRAYSAAGKETVDKLLDLGDTTDKLRGKSARMAQTLQSNIQGLKTSFYEFADSNLAAPLANITKLLNELTAHPERVKRLFTEIAVGLGAIAAVKGIAGIMRVMDSMKGLKGGNVNITEKLSAASAMPVYVTNWGGAGLGAGNGNTFTGTGMGGGGLLDQYGNPVRSNQTPGAGGKGGPKFNRANMKSSLKAGGIGAAVTALVAIPGMISELSAIENDPDKTKAEKAEESGGAVGATAGNVVGALIGGTIGSFILPGVGTMIGAAIGEQLGGIAGRWVGGKLGVSLDKSNRALEIAQEEYDSAAREASDTLGKTSEEIRVANSLLEEARKRLEEVKYKEEHQTWSMGGGYVDKAPPTTEGKVWSAGSWVDKDTKAPGAEGGMWSAGGCIPKSQLPPQITSGNQDIMTAQSEPVVVGTEVTFKDDRTEVIMRGGAASHSYKHPTGNAPASRDLSL